MSILVFSPNFHQINNYFKQILWSPTFGTAYIFRVVNHTAILVNNCLVISATVDAGHQAVIFDRFRGVQESAVGEGTHFLIPWVQKPIIFDCRSRPRNVPVITGSKGTSATADLMCAHVLNISLEIIIV